MRAVQDAKKRQAQVAQLEQLTGGGGSGFNMPEIVVMGGKGGPQGNAGLLDSEDGAAAGGQFKPFEYDDVLGDDDEEEDKEKEEAEKADEKTALLSR